MLKEKINDTNQRITDALREYWESKKGGRPFPGEDEINQDDLREIWDNCFLVEIEGDKFRYSFLGDSIIEAYGDNLEGDEIVENEIYPESTSVINKLREVAESKEPVLFEGAFINKNNMDIKFRKTLLPLGEGDEV